MKNQHIKKAFVLTVFLVSFCSIGYIFWWQDYQYSLPTPKPAGYKEIPFGHQSSIEWLGHLEKPVLIHFFNVKCPCSKFNTEHFAYLVKTYRHQLDFIVVFQNKTEDADSSFFNKLSANIRYIVDNEGIYADSLGVYSTPQAVLIDKKGKIFYRGNYNKTRYCVNENTQYARLAIDELLYNHNQGKTVILANQSQALTAYGCQLPSDKY